MKITKLCLNNIRSYDEETVEFPDGTVLIRGDNGAGKSTLLMSIFGGLFLSKIRNVGSNNFNLDDLVRRGTESGEIELTFEVENVPYTVTWTIDTSGSNGAVIESPALDEPHSGIRAVQEKVNEVIGMDADSFSRSVYVQQGEIDRLFDDEARAELIDDLLGLDQIDRYRTRMKGARRAANRLVTENEKTAENHRETIYEEFEYDVGGYESALATKESEIADVESELTEVKDYLEQLRDVQRELQSDIENHDELKSDLEDSETEREELVDEKAATQREIENTETAIAESQNDIENLETQIENIKETIETLDEPETIEAIEADLSTETNAKETLEATQEAVESARIEETNRERSLEQAVETRDRLQNEHQELQEECEELNESLSTLKGDVEAAELDIQEIETEISEAVDERNTAVEELLPNGLIPDSITADTRSVVESHIDEIKSQRNTQSEELAGTKASLEAKEETVADFRSNVDAASSERDRLEDRIDSVESDLSTTRGELEDAREQFDTELSTVSTKLAPFDVSVSADTLGTAIDEGIPNAKREIQQVIDNAGSRVTELETQKSGLEDERKELQSLDGETTCPKCGQDVDATHLETEREAISEALSVLDTQLESARDEHAEKLSRRDELDEIREQAVELRDFRQDTVETVEERVENLNEERDDLREELAAEHDTLEEAEHDLTEAESAVDDLTTTIAELKASIEELETSIEKGEAVLDQFDIVDDLRDELEERTDDLGDLTEELTDTETEVEELNEEIDSLSTEIEQQQQTVSNGELELDAATATVSVVERQRELVSEAVDAYDDIDGLQTEIQSHRKDIEHARDTIYNLNKQISNVETDIEDLENELGSMDIEETKAKLEDVDDRIDQREETVEELDEKRQSLEGDRKVLENELDQLQRFRERLELAESKREWSQDRSDEFEMMMRVYQSTKSDLREQYLTYINEYTNDIFTDIYKNSSYQQVQILEEGPDGTPYAIQLLRDDGTLEHPSNASGGERAIVNLALRAGIYKLIAEMRGGDSGRLPPFILDEPTTFLDAGHVGRLEQMLDSIAEWDVPQVIVVSHDERLIQGSEHECIVQIDEDTNASTVDVRTGGRAFGDD